MTKSLLKAVCLTCFCTMCTPVIRAQHRVNPRNMYERVLAIVPWTGAGTLANPTRAMYAPEAISPTAQTGIVAFQCIPSDNGRLALCEFVAKDRGAFQSLMADPSVQSFLKGRDNIQAALTLFKALRKDFDPNHFGVRMQ
jgi:hypothetical protein